MWKFSELERAIEVSWCKETTSDPENYSEEYKRGNPAWGQCAVTSLVVQDYFGGEIVNCKVEGLSHYYNIIDGREVDLTAKQFPKDTEIPEGVPKPGEFESTRQYVLGANENTPLRYFKLKRLVEVNIKEI